ncbi:pyridoxamine 5'-phosphate oxidase family protein [Streptomyces sp. DSM 44915]|uniref:Pyridoxamine 5'-phosphate oxidase family protein n=1 Tax=Streptomyces chisholmiae TaxID=3075540 RepID=A0ABU2JZU7_9ACTN|nr:pyridoxamine 5'-phosphate oxidase family protein [Streptomyces sp. DSM 44915]MDT0270494.1 pyridoxamine 5'-phosphate oxidase family protein [Streptomyces sp. DSM 44915]
MPLSTEDRERFLAEPHIAALSVHSGREDRAPLTVPVWYQYRPGAELWVLTGKDSRKHRLIAEAGRFTIMVERLVPTIRYVSVEGPVTSVTEGGEAELREVSARYLPPEKVEGYVAVALAEHGPQVVIRLRPERWISSDLGTL